MNQNEIQYVITFLFANVIFEKLIAHKLYLNLFPTNQIAAFF